MYSILGKIDLIIFIMCMSWWCICELWNCFLIFMFMCILGRLLRSNSSSQKRNKSGRCTLEHVCRRGSFWLWQLIPLWNLWPAGESSKGKDRHCLFLGCPFSTFARRSIKWSQLVWNSVEDIHEAVNTKDRKLIYIYIYLYFNFYSKGFF